MAMVFTSEHVEVPTDMDQEQIRIDLYQEFELSEDQAPIRAVSIELSEDQAVELATLLLMGATKLRAERLAEKS